MSICITGDTHGGFQRFSADNFPQQRQMGRDDFAVVTGDFGGVWDDSSGEAYYTGSTGWTKSRLRPSLWMETTKTLLGSMRSPSTSGTVGRCISSAPCASRDAGADLRD